MLIQPVYPHERLLAGESATVTAEFTVNAEGQTEDVAMVNPTGGDFEEAMRAAVESWVFNPARGGQGPASVRVRVTHAFTPTAADARLAELLKPGGSGVAGPSGLDQKMKPLWRGFPVYPKSLLNDKPDGRAVIEFVIDRDGRARAPKIVEASAPEFGWAAATAISQWVFERPRRGGQPADVRVRVPVEFKPPHA
jgi:TonB family protein